ncbi:hypothetical protein CPHO_08225 [Corynebacterium phocae]|uniref:Tyr recombinase domain-containing protein n=1 Tax=Corynebacterium phocae TaxID=161895 RepID=A0A1L7D4M9_9CORY|nr:site-specific integrase [Corynebacterium phocae]APT92872.1 hypothetical protein CPHO_08225 [Corynebacterium phocae]
MIPARAHWVASPEAAAAAYIGGLSATTGKSYGAALRRWLHFCDDTGLDPWGVQAVHIEGWLKTMSPHTARGVATAVCGYYAYAHRHGLTKLDLGAGVRRPRTGRRRPGTWATREELARMMDISQELGGDTYALLAMLILMGTRVGETCALDIADIEQAHGELLITLRRKMGHTDIITVPARVQAALQPLLDRRSSGAVLRHEGRRMSTARARYLVSSIAEQAECQQKITPHSLRRSFVTLARDLGVSDEDIMAMTGHADVTMIDYYDRGRRQRGGVAGMAVEAALGDV